MSDENEEFKALENDIEMLNGYLAEFKVLEKHAPEVAQRLGFAGYLNYATIHLFGNEQYTLLDKMADNIEKIAEHLANR